jgi:hypothetical protein
VRAVLVAAGVLVALVFAGVTARRLLPQIDVPRLEDVPAR